MSFLTKKRFWTSADVFEAEGKYGISLDGRPVQTPAKARLLVPTKKIAQGIAAEWDAQEEQIDPLSMPTTRWANAATDKVASQMEDVVGMLASYGDSDLLCYRAAGPETLVARQAEAWDPVLEWAAEQYDAPLASTTGVIPVKQSNQSVENLRVVLQRFDAFQLASVHDLVTISGSLILALAVFERKMSPQIAWSAARIDETWQKELWGEDEEAEAAEEVRRTAFMFAHQMLTMLVYKGKTAG
ncbi:MAG: ATPase [Rhodobacteraceae bacterium]|nr:ATPase [Paracoccaceae bacterium]